MQPQLVQDPGPEADLLPAADGLPPEPSFDDVPPAERALESALESAPVRKAGADLPADADPDLLLHAIQKREQRSFAIKLASVLCGFFLAAYLAGSGNGAILQGIIHLAVGGVAGAGATLLWQRRRAARNDAAQ